MTNSQKNMFFKFIAEHIELPDSAYDKAAERYENIGEWLGRRNSAVSGYDPHIFPQGSFRLGTAIRPLNGEEEYDLDLVCKLREGISKVSHTQKDLKNLIGSELKAYREAYGIKKNIEEKKRCWRMEYQDKLSFHLDIVPAISGGQDAIAKAQKVGRFKQVSSKILDETLSITDKTHLHYSSLCADWPITNPEGYAKWFEQRMQQIKGECRAGTADAQIAPVPHFLRKTILQRVVQILKRHRDIFFQDNIELKPSSIIITTLASHAYEGEQNFIIALKNILWGMQRFINAQQPFIVNPANCDEDLADSWSSPTGKKLQLKENFIQWIVQAQQDFLWTDKVESASSLSGYVQKRYGIRSSLPEELTQMLIGKSCVIVAPVSIFTPASVPKPWSI